MKGKEIIKELNKSDWEVIKKSNFHDILLNKDKNIIIPIPTYKNRELGKDIIDKIENITGLQISKNINVKNEQISLENILNQMKQILKDGCTEKEMKEMLSEISTPKQADKLISIAKEQIQNEIKTTIAADRDGPEM